MIIIYHIRKKLMYNSNIFKYLLWEQHPLNILKSVYCVLSCIVFITTDQQNCPLITERGDSFHCRCHAWWEGTRCERRMMHIPFRPLSERMLHEPFWLGLITVTIVLGIIGLVWCARRHFPEKLEKLLAEETDRNRIRT